MGIEEIYKSKGCKVLKAQIAAGGKMPTHYATSEAFVMVIKGEAKFISSNEQRTLTAGTTFQITEKKPHTLHIVKDFEAYIVIGANAEIEFVNQAEEKAMNQQ